MFILNFIREKLAVLIMLALAFGLVNGKFNPMEYSRIICISALVLMILPIYVNLDIIGGLKQIQKTLKPMAISAIVNFLIYPALAYFIGYFFLQNNPAIWLGLVLLSLVPTSGMTIGWTYHTGGNTTTSMAVISVSILIAFLFLPFAVPFFTENILGQSFSNISRMVILEKLFFIIVIPAIAGTIIRKLVLNYAGEDYFKKLKPINNSISCIGLLVVTFLVMSLETTQTLTSNPENIWIIALPVIMFYLIIFTTSHFLGKVFLDIENARSFFFSTAARYHVITLGVVLGAFQEFEFLGMITAVIALGLAVQIPSLAIYAKSLK